jgi:DNA ligase (NAD+)
MSLWRTIGFTEHHPRYAIAYKFPAEIVTTTLLSVEHSVGRTGTITPVANLEAVTIGWAMIRRSTLHNYEEVEKLWLKVGDRVFLKRAGEVIPKIIGVASSSHPNTAHETSPHPNLLLKEKGRATSEQTVASSSPLGEELWWGVSGGIILPPELCPSCGVRVAKDEDKVRYYCPNSISCPAQMIEKFAFAVGKHGFDIDNFGEKQAELFVSLGWLRNLGDIFRLKHHQADMLELEGFQEKSVNNLLASIEVVRSMELLTFLKALGIPGVGKKTAKTLAKYFQSWMHSLQTALWGITQEELEALPDIGPEVAGSVVTFFEVQRAMIEDVLGEVVITRTTPHPNPLLPGEGTNSKLSYYW